MENEKKRKSIFPNRKPNFPLSTFHSPLFPSPTVALALVLLAFVGMQAVSVLWHLFFPSARGSVSARYVEILVQQCLMLALPAALYLLRTRPWATAMRMRALPAGACVCLLLAAVAAMFALNMLTVLWALLMDALGLPLVGSSVPPPGNAGELWLSLLVIGITPALCEELLFRGLVQPSLERMGTRRALLLGGLLFALMHGQITALPAHLLLGFVLGALLVGYGSLLAPMIFHAAYNGVTMAFGYVQRNAALEQAERSASGLPDLSAAELIAGVAPVLIVAGLATVAFIWLPMRWAARKNPPPRFEATGERLPPAAKVLLVILLLYFVFTYAMNIVMTAHWAGVSA
ncbi:MAG: CPBP family intramembrane metalloprotease [Clostridia bacterium]|nr:CPBP family intramembrane metalloprotease [Clostridia bacterium]